MRTVSKSRSWSAEDPYESENHIELSELRFWTPSAAWTDILALISTATFKGLLLFLIDPRWSLTISDYTGTNVGPIQC